MNYIIRYSYKLTSTSRQTSHYVRSEYAINRAEHATVFNSLESAENAADIIRENIKGYAKNVRFDFIPQA